MKTTASLEDRMAQLERRIVVLEASHAIANLQARYIYSLQAHDYQAIADMFARRAPVSVEMDNLGHFKGREKTVDVFLKVLKPLYTMKGALGLHMLTTPLVEVHPDGEVAWGQWHTMGCNTQPDFVGQDHAVSAEPVLIAMWQQGKYFIDFIQEDGEWKFQHFRWYVNFRTPFDEGWVKRPITGNLSTVAKLMPGCPEPDGPSPYRPFSPDELTPFDAPPAAYK